MCCGCMHACMHEMLWGTQCCALGLCKICMVFCGFGDRVWSVELCVNSVYKDIKLQSLAGLFLLGLSFREGSCVFFGLA